MLKGVGYHIRAMRRKLKWMLEVGSERSTASGDPLADGLSDSSWQGRAVKMRLCEITHGESDSGI